MFKKITYFILLLFVQFKSYAFDIKAPSVILQDYLSGEISTPCIHATYNYYFNIKYW